MSIFVTKVINCDTIALLSKPYSYDLVPSKEQLSKLRKLKADMKMLEKLCR